MLLQGLVCMWLSQSCWVSQASDMWICGLTAEEFITDNYIRMCWKRNKPRTVWAGRCWASAYTVPRAPCTPDSHSSPHRASLSLKGQQRKHWNPGEPKWASLLFLTLQLPCFSFLHYTFHTFNFNFAEHTIDFLYIYIYRVKNICLQVLKVLNKSKYIYFMEVWIAKNKVHKFWKHACSLTKLGNCGFAE